MSDKDYDSDAPEELTAEQGLIQYEDITKTQKENKSRVVREAKERRKQWAQKKTPRPSKANKTRDGEKVKVFPVSVDSDGLLPNHIVEELAAREKLIFTSDSEEDADKKAVSVKKKKVKKVSSGIEAVIVKDMPAAATQCLQNSLDFLKKRKMLVSRSSAVLDNPSQALRFISTSAFSTVQSSSNTIRIWQKLFFQGVIRRNLIVTF